ncbi:transposase [Cucumis melo var. makuwa]|uniref:Transposase n=1 Tax=Cucumis melo var. makuwa TaxID=1194695 RepID=A0A5D3CC77_CUCMM|nr:transposase [Cucumis melo var. makuwa]
MESSSCTPKHVWTKEEEATLVECLVEFYPGVDESQKIVRSDQGLGDGLRCRDFADVESNDPSRYGGFQMPNGIDMEIPAMYNQGFCMSKYSHEISREIWFVELNLF